MVDIFDYLYGASNYQLLEAFIYILQGIFMVKVIKIRSIKIRFSPLFGLTLKGFHLFRIIIS